jgi:nitroimidazol reductase NimA-like FMN-containing flavoprotein (pyridoxamine 5'-phosphate oxidase superfamily)
MKPSAGRTKSIATPAADLMPNFPVTTRNRVRRMPKRGHYDRATVHAIIDEALVCHVAFVTDGMPTVIPTLHARRGDELLLHGARTSRMLQHVAAGNPVSVAFTLLDGIVLARSVFHHSMNYRSVVLHGTGQLVESTEDKLAALEAFAEHIARGRWADARQPTRKELKATSVVSIPIELAAAKVRTGPPLDEEEDYALPVWAGVLPLTLHAGTAIPDPRLGNGINVPGYVRRYRRGNR